ncbi:MAG TPA: bifunctional DNA primase/polymerase [Chloroflexota bacterium]|nr:bifunctional DNA primase/polymerase [Chloroflexota bacterium]
MPDATRLKAIQGYLKRGWYVIPLCWPSAGECGCGRGHTGKEIGKAPLLGSGYQNRRSTESDVNEWWTRWPDANIGILLEPSGLLVIDCDGVEALREARLFGLPEGPVVRSGNGVHIYYKAGDATGRATKQGNSHAIDVLASGFVVAPPSRHRNGHTYEWRRS